MKRKLKAILLSAVLILMLSVAVGAETNCTISYDYGVAGIKSPEIISSNPDSCIPNSEIILSNPECPGFEFVGWYLESDYITQVTDITVSDDITLYAKWYEMTYSIDYILTTDGIPIAANEINNTNPHVRSASEEVFLSVPGYSSDRFTFEGWYTDKNYTEKIEIIGSYTCKDITLYAHWVNSQFNIFYELGDVADSVYTTENPNPDTYTYGTNTTIAPAVTNDPAYTFDGWYTDEFFTQKVDSISDTLSGDITLYAKWNKNVYTIDYVLTDGNSVSEADIENPNETTRTADSDFILNAPVTTDKSYEFAGWYTSPDFSENTEISIIREGITENVTVYAKWVQAVYTINYDYGIVDIKLCPIENTNITTYLYGDTAALEDLSAEGFIFNGWCTDENLKNHITEITADMYGDLTLYADFTEKTYTINYVLEDKEVAASQVANSNSNVRTTTERFYFDDAETINVEYKFGGWYFDSEFTQKADFIKAYTAENITVYAKWIKIVSYTPVWGDASLSNQLSAADARLILRYAAKLETSFNDVRVRLSDVNNDSKITSADARLALRLAAKLENMDEIIEKHSLPEIKLVDGEVVFDE